MVYGDPKVWPQSSWHEHKYSRKKKSYIVQEENYITITNYKVQVQNQNVLRVELHVQRASGTKILPSCRINLLEQWRFNFEVTGLVLYVSLIWDNRQIGIKRVLVRNYIVSCNGTESSTYVRRYWIGIVSDRRGGRLDEFLN